MLRRPFSSSLAFAAITMVCAVIPTHLMAAFDTKPVDYYRVYSDSEGQSHVEKAHFDGQYQDDFGKSDIMKKYFHSKTSSVTINTVQPNFVAPQHNTGGKRDLIMVLRGSSTVYCSDGTHQTFKAGDLILLEDKTGPGTSIKFGPHGYIGMVTVLED